MIFIYKELAKKYINKLSVRDLEKFARMNNINYTKDDLIVVYNFILNNYNELLDENINVFLKIRDKISPELYKKLLNLYVEYKQKYL